MALDMHTFRQVHNYKQLHAVYFVKTCNFAES